MHPTKMHTCNILFIIFNKSHYTMSAIAPGTGVHRKYILDARCTLQILGPAYAAFTNCLASLVKRDGICGVYHSCFFFTFLFSFISLTIRYTNDITDDITWDYISCDVLHNIFKGIHMFFLDLNKISLTKYLKLTQFFNDTQNILVIWIIKLKYKIFMSPYFTH